MLSSVIPIVISLVFYFSFLEFNDEGASSSTGDLTPSTPGGSDGLEFHVGLELILDEENMEFSSEMPEQLSGDELSPILEEDEKLIFHQNQPVFAVQNRPVDAEEALGSVINCPEEKLSKSPPNEVSENFCFVLDGDVVKVTDMAKSDDWWKPTGKPTRYYYSPDLKSFYRVNIVLVKGRIISARIRSGSAGFGAKASESDENPRAPALTPNTVVPIGKVFQVCRFYSYWKNCPTYHRIVTTISPLRQAMASRIHFKRRIFVQYLWSKNAKPADKLKVALESNAGRSMSLPKTPNTLSVAASSSAHKLRRNTVNI